MTLRNVSHYMLTFLNFHTSFRAIEWPTLAMSKGALERMSFEELHHAYAADFSELVGRPVKESFINNFFDFRSELLIDRCALYVDRASEISGGPYGLKFIRAARDSIRQEWADQVRASKP